VRTLLNDWIEDGDDIDERRKTFEKTSRECVQKFQVFLVEFFRTRIFGASVSPEAVVADMVHSQSDPKEDRNRMLEILLDDARVVASTPVTDEEALVDKLCRKNVALCDGVHRMSKSFSTVCQIILDLFLTKFFEDLSEAEYFARNDPVIG
jgi:hypothetical protein